MRAMVVGSTGLVGKKVIEELVADSRITKIFVVSRRSQSIKSSKIEEVIISNLKEIRNLHPDYEADLYFCCLGTTIKKAGSKQQFREVDEIGVFEFAKLASLKSSSVFILVSSKGANEQSSIFYSKIKGRVERLVIELQISSVVIFRPSLLIGDREESRLGESLAIKAYQVLDGFLPRHWMKVMGTEVDVLAQAMVKKALSSSSGVEILESHQILA